MLKLFKKIFILSLIVLGASTPTFGSAKLSTSFHAHVFDHGNGITSESRPYTITTLPNNEFEISHGSVN